MKAGQLIDAIANTGLHPHRNEAEVIVDGALADGKGFEFEIVNVRIRGGKVVLYANEIS